MAVSKMLIGFWFSGVLFGMFQLWDYETTPGAESLSPSDWPQNTLILPSTEKPTLVMLLHSQCSCSTSSLKFLEELTRDFPGKFETKILFFRPANKQDEWLKRDLWNEALHIPNTEIKIDNNGETAKLFGAKTSGHTTLYGSDLKLLFGGGLARTRGLGETSSGVESIVSALSHLPIKITHTPTYGCSITEES